jgi:hypothetical protein
MSTDKMSALRAGRPSESRKATTLTSLADKGPTVRINFDLERDEHRRLKMLGRVDGFNQHQSARKTDDG